MSMRAAALVAIPLLAAASLSAQHPFGPGPNCGRVRYPLNGDWRHLEANPRDPAALDAVPASAWTAVQLPHTWNRFAMGLRWQVRFAAGDNALRAVCLPARATMAPAGTRPPARASAAARAAPATKAAPGVVADSTAVRYTTVPAGGPDHFQLSSQPLPNGHVLIEAVAVDADGRHCLDYQKRVYFSHEGAGELLVDRGTPTGSQVIEMANGHAAIEFAPGAGGRAVVDVRSQDLKGDFLELDGGNAATAQQARLDSLARSVLDSAAARYTRVAARLDPATGYPRYAGADGAWHTAKLNEWTSGFFPGMLWQLYGYELSAAASAAERKGAARETASLAETLRAQAERWTAPLPAIFEGKYSHDLGFQFFTTNVAAYRLTGEERYRRTALTAARLLAGRFNPAVGAIKSWDWMQADRPFPVIADNMMNLELLFWAAKHGGPRDWAALALRHAETTRLNHVRPDGGSFHVVVFDAETGKVRQRITHQGYADSTTWARGEAWLLYGFTMAYRETRAPDLLETAQRVADYFVAHLPDDGVPCWDFQAPGCPGGPGLRDASAAAIAASGLLELSGYAPAAAGERYRRAAETILGTLTSPPYLAGAGADALLLHATGNRPAESEVDVALVYADYYLVQALLRYVALRGPAAATLSASS